DINGAVGGTVGVNYFAAGVLQIENCRITAFTGGSSIGVNFAGPGQLHISDTQISQNSTGISVHPNSASALVSLERVQLKDNGDGFKASGASGGVVFATVVDSLAASGSGGGFIATSTGGTKSVSLDIQRSASNLNGGAGINADGAQATIFIGTSMVTQ